MCAALRALANDSVSRLLLQPHGFEDARPLPVDVDARDLATRQTSGDAPSKIKRYAARPASTYCVSVECHALLPVDDLLASGLADKRLQQRLPDLGDGLRPDTDARAGKLSRVVPYRV